jgi:hypothetical protein
MPSGEREAAIRAASLSGHAPSLAVFAKTMLASVGASDERLMEAFASMALNRFLYEKDLEDGASLVSVLTDEDEFPCWRDVKAMDGIDLASEGFRLCLRVARRALSGCLADSMRGATRFSVDWGNGRKGMRVGRYMFFN